MRFDTHRVGAFLVEELQKSRPRLEVILDDGDIMHVRTDHGQLAAIYMVETVISPLELRYHLVTNTAAGMYSMFILWAELLMPAHGTRFVPHDWMSALMALHGDRIYAYDPYGGDNLIFPVYFDREQGRRARGIRHGSAIQPSRLSCLEVEVSVPELRGTFRVADFEQRVHVPSQRHVVHDALTPYFTLLGVDRRATAAATRAAVKRAYRRLARQHHPDISDHPDSAETMRRLNEAYTRIIDTLDAGASAAD
jgi:hypothetical protein